MGLDEYQWLDGDTAQLCCNSYWHFWGSRHDPYDQTLSKHLYDNQHVIAEGTQNTMQSDIELERVEEVQAHVVAYNAVADDVAETHALFKEWLTKLWAIDINSAVFVGQLIEVKRTMTGIMFVLAQKGITMPECTVQITAPYERFIEVVD